MRTTAADRVDDHARRAPGDAGTLTASSKYRYATTLCILLLTLGGCIPVPRGGDGLDLDFMSGDELRAYAEEAFRHQNRVTTRLMMAPLDSPSISDDDRRRIEQAESEMNDACASLNEIASARARGEEADAALENTVRRTVRTCVRKTERLERILDVLDVGRGMPGNRGRPASPTGLLHEEAVRIRNALTAVKVGGQSRS